MKEWIRGKRDVTLSIFREYGKVIIFSILIAVLLCAVWLAYSVTSTKQLRVSFLDIGQGDAIFIETPSGKQMLIDGGPTNKVLEELDNEMSFFDRNIDVILATHPDADHVTGLIPVLEKFEVDTVMLSPSDGHTGLYDDVRSHVDNEHSIVHIAHTGDIIDFHDGVQVRVLYPAKNYIGSESDTNDASVSVLLSYGDKTFLLTGDLPSVREQELISNGLPKNSTVYKAGHHGSKTSSGEQLLSYIKPEYAVISAGKDNKYGHPNPETIERLQKYSREILSTIDHGTITFVTDGKSVEVETER